MRLVEVQVARCGWNCIGGKEQATKVYEAVLARGSLVLLFHPVLSLFPSFYLPDVLCDSTDLIWRKGTPFEAMSGRTAPSSDGLLAKVFWGSPQL